MLELRDYQQSGMDDIRREFRLGHSRVLYVAPTGAGKTVIFAHIAEGASGKGHRIYILVHRQELIKQTSQKLVDLGVKHGIIWGPQPLNRERVQVCSVQTLAKRLDRIRPADLIVIDEAHHSVAGSYRTVIDRWPQAKLLGVTATPHRADGIGLDMVYQTMVLGPSTGELIERGYLSEFKAYGPPQQLDLSNVRLNSLGSDYMVDDLEGAIDKPSITGDAVKHYIRYCWGKPGIAFCVSRKHAEHVAQQFRREGIAAQAIDGSVSDSQRMSILADFATGVVKVLTSCDLVSEGFDVPEVVAAILLRPTKSSGLAIQQIGRCLRIAPGKERAYILDHVGNCRLHGLPDEPRNWSLLGTKARVRAGITEAVTPVKQCPSCYAQFSPRALCPECGHLMPVAGRQIEEQEGELQEITGRAESKKSEQGRAKTLEELIAIGKKRGFRYPEMWARHVLKGREKTAS
jgi:superfamily II DNA or RNA helicase